MPAKVVASVIAAILFNEDNPSTAVKRTHDSELYALRLLPFD